MNADQKLAKAIELHNKGEFIKAQGIYKELNSKYPKEPDILNLLGVSYYQSGQYIDSKKYLAKAIKINSKNAGYYCNLGVTLKAMGKIDKAMENFNLALSKDPNLAQAYVNIGNIYLDNKLYTDADISYSRAYNLNKADLNCIINFALTKFKLKEYNNAINLYNNYLQFKPDDHYAHNQLSKIFAINNDIVKAFEMSQRAYGLNPVDEAVVIQYYDMAKQICAFDKVDELTPKLDEFYEKAAINKTKPHEPPFINIARCQDLEINFNIAKLWSAQLIPGKQTRHYKKHDGKIVIGYMSSDFHAHATAYLIEGLLKNHNRDKFKIVAISYTKPDDSKYYSDLKELFDQYIDIYSLTDNAAAKLIQDAAIDLLVDLKGFTGNSRLELLNYNLAPVIINYLGYPGTMGTCQHDYIIADKNLIYQDEHKYYSEEVIYMPHSYQCTNNMESVTLSVSRADEGLPEDKIILCCFNQPYKITRKIFQLWLNILSNNPNTVLWLLEWNILARDNLLDLASLRGVEERLFFASKKPRREHLARLKLSDIVLDTPIYNGHTSTTDALFCGVPVVGLRGSHFASRVSSSLLVNCKLEELICDDLESYVNKISYIINNPDYLEKLKNKLRDTSNLELFDTSQFTEDLEELYINCFSKL